MVLCNRTKNEVSIRVRYYRNLKQKSILIIITIIALTIFATYSILYILYDYYHKQQISNNMSRLLYGIEKEYDRLDEIKDWLKNNVDLTLYTYDSIEELSENVPFAVNEKDKALLEQGELVVNSVEITDLQYSVLLFTYPKIENEKIDQLLFIYYPLIHRNSDSTILLNITFIFTLLAVLGTFLLTKRLFAASYSQLQEIKEAAIYISNGNYNAKLCKNSDDEVGEITEVFNEMAAALSDNQRRTKEFFQDISHEINTPLTYIKAYNEALKDGIIQDTDRRLKYHELIDHETIRLQKLVQTFLDYTRLDAQVVELQTQPIAFAQCIEDIMQKYDPIFADQKILSEMNLNYDVIIDGDEERIEQIIQNIIQNAIRYKKDDSRIFIHLIKNEKECELIIADNGIGISEEHLAVITNRFVRVNKISSRNESGTGIGLSIVEKLMILHGGNMNIESKLGFGTTVILTFPLYEAL